MPNGTPSDKPALMRNELDALERVRVKLQTVLNAIDAIRIDRPPLEQWPLAGIAEQTEVAAIMLTQSIRRQYKHTEPLLDGVDSIRL